jgi:hypothetical protein
VAARKAALAPTNGQFSRVPAWYWRRSTFIAIGAYRNPTLVMWCADQTTPPALAWKQQRHPAYHRDIEDLTPPDAEHRMRWYR